METTSYWSKFLLQRLNRRRAVSAAGAAALAGVVTAACGGGGEEESENKLGLLSKPLDETKQAKRGGTLKWFQENGDPASFDPAFPTGATNLTVSLAYNLLIRQKPGFLEPADNRVDPEIGESWEFSPDNTQLTFRLRQGVKFHNKAPVNGRPLDQQDILFSWDRMSRLASNRSSLVNSVNPDAPVVSVSASDSKTIVFKLNRPHSYILNLLSLIYGALWIVPREADGGFDIRREVIGAGPYLLENYTPSSILTFKRHPGYWENDAAFVESIEAPIVPSQTAYATGVSQFRAGQIYTYPIKADEILQMKRDLPDLNIYSGEVSTSAFRTGFGWLPEGKSPFLDVRVRQAYSMAIDRDLFIEAKHNVSKFESDGLPVQTRWNSAITAGFEGYWLDPKGKDFGANAKYYQHNVAEAKKLLAAAGYPDGLDVNSYAPHNGISAGKDVEILDAFANEVGFRTKLVTMDYPSEFVPKYRDGKGQHDGWASKVGSQGNGPPDAIGQLAYLYYSKGGANFYGAAPDPYVETQIEKGLIEFDEEKRRAIAFDLQRHLAEKQYYVNYPGGATGFSIAWPVIRNFSTYRGWSDGRRSLKWWLDETQAPLKKA